MFLSDAKFKYNYCIIYFCSFSRFLSENEHGLFHCRILWLCLLMRNQRNLQCFIFLAWSTGSMLQIIWTELFLVCNFSQFLNLLVILKLDCNTLYLNLPISFGSYTLSAHAERPRYAAMERLIQQTTAVRQCLSQELGKVLKCF